MLVQNQSTRVSSLALTMIVAVTTVSAVYAAPGNLTGRPGAIRLSDKDDNDVVIKVDELPKAIRDYIAKDMPDSKITEARKDFKGNKEKTGENFIYEVEVKQGKKEYEFKFSPDGKLLKKREEAGDEPDDKK